MEHLMIVKQQVLVCELYNQLLFCHIVMLLYITQTQLYNILVHILQYTHKQPNCKKKFKKIKIATPMQNGLREKSSEIQGGE